MINNTKLIISQWDHICHDGCDLDNVYHPNAPHDVAWCRACNAWLHVPCCTEVELQEERQLEDFNQMYVMGHGIQNEDFRLLLMTPIRRFSRQESSPLSIEMLQAQAQVWISQQSSLPNDDNWLETMLHTLEGNWLIDKVRAALEEVRVLSGECRWVMCGKCLTQFI